MAGQGSNMEQFEVYFQRADLDRDGRISGVEAVTFLQGSNLPKQVLAQVWMHADQSHCGFLSRGEFYNALKLVTVAQSKRELTPEIVKAALYGPASAKIPAPQINLAAIPAPQSNSVGAAPAPVPSPQMRTVGPQLGAVTPTVSQHPGFRGQAPQSQQYLPSQGSHLMRPPLAAPSTGVVRPQHGVAGLDFPRGGGAVTSGPPALHGVAGGTTSGPTRPTPNRGITPNTLVASRSLDSLSAIANPRNENTSDSMFGGDAFSVSQTLPRQGSAPPFSASNAPASTALAPVTSGSQSSAKPDPFEALQSTFTRPSGGSQQQLTQSTSKTSQQHSAQTITPLPSSGIPAAAVNSTAEQPQPSWPKMTRAGVQKYAKVFMEVDTDRDGRITGEQARNLFLSWRLPREVLKQVWDLADQDNDSMLSLREFCIALYLMERYREGRPIPSTLPNSVLLDETLISLAGPPTVSYGTAGWGQTPGMPGAQQNSHAGLRPQMQPVAPQPDGSMQFNNQNTGSLTMENSNPNQLSNGEQNTLESKGEEEGEKKVEDKDKVILDSREKLEYYRTKMQDLVLYKSRCDNRLNEITERALADKREVRADRIQSDLEELLKALTERCKKHSVTVKSTALIELPHGWQPGIPEISAVWDEDWDKFEDEGFSFDVAVSATAKSTSHQRENSPTRSNSPNSISNAEAKSEQLFSHGVSTLETESTYAHSEDESKSPQGSPAGQRAFQSPSQEFSDDHFGKSFETDAETNRSFDGSAWGTFDNNDDVDSVWGFSAKDSNNDKHGENYFFGSNDFGGSPVRTGSPAAESRFQKNSPFFEDSVPGSPLSRAGNSPRRYSVGSGDPFESFSRYDSFSTHDRTSSPQRETLTRFDSMSSTSGFDHSRGFSFDDSDPFGSSGPFKVSSESQTPKKSTDSWNAF
ncbi:PREDICTED: epidermal growth factor receptor substrate 15-like 1 isoform X2 [Ipomoea nil]|uniref:epidermal growth factor receptor substrate 15-like 1 isoform X2 n=1 Tax=Ipomoea nil TaxID=35883 RepID=UPI000901C24F|nr:PREDICTED: epidermal growth factor receptor substrate 15-like 1 isoform X2 [Ipomoea nil]